jgi:hypothetical protein
MVGFCAFNGRGDHCASRFGFAEIWRLGPERAPSGCLAPKLGYQASRLVT